MIRRRARLGVRARLVVAALIGAAVVLVVAVVVAAVVVRKESSAGARWTLPPANAGFDYQIGGPFTPAEDVRVVVRDWHVTPAAGRYSVCYVDVFQTQAEDEQWWMTRHADLLLRRDGTPIEDPNWPKQYLLDTSTRAKRDAIAAIERSWITSCAKKGFDAVEMDNLDSWYRSFDLLTPEDNLALAASLTEHAHGLGLAVAQKNGAVLKGRGKQAAGFDFAIAESCEVYDECSSYTDTYGDRVYEIEYTDEEGDPFQRACAARGSEISIILRDRLVVPRGEPGYRSESC